MNHTNSELLIYQTSDGQTRIDVKLVDDTVWLNRNQMAELFDRDVKTIGKHIHNALNEELHEIPTVAKFATVQTEGNRTVTRNVEYYNLDMILSVGYRVKSPNGILFRRWANIILKDYLIRGYAKNDSKLKELGIVVEILKRSVDQLESKQILDVIEQYSRALDLLDGYDHRSIAKPKGRHDDYRLTYEECRQIILDRRFTTESTLFGREKDDSFQSSIETIYQTFGGEELYPSTQEKAANLLYLIVKNHSFSDGNKRIGAAIFVYYLGKTGILSESVRNPLDNNTLVALTIMIACSRPDDKEVMVNLVMNFLEN